MRGDGALFQPTITTRAMVPASVRFLDVNPDYTQNRYGILTTEQVSIRHQIKNVLTTPLGSEEHEPLYGCNLPFRIMEAINRINAALIRTDIVEALVTWMSTRIVVQLHLLAVVELELEDGYRIDVPYTSVATNDSDLYSFEVLR